MKACSIAHLRSLADTLKKKHQQSTSQFSFIIPPINTATPNATVNANHIRKNRHLHLTFSLLEWQHASTRLDCWNAVSRIHEGNGRLQKKKTQHREIGPSNGRIPQWTQKPQMDARSIALRSIIVLRRFTGFLLAISPKTSFSSAQSL